MYLRHRLTQCTSNKRWCVKFWNCLVLACNILPATTIVYHGYQRGSTLNVSDDSKGSDLKQGHPLFTNWVTKTSFEDFGNRDDEQKGQEKGSSSVEGNEMGNVRQGREEKRWNGWNYLEKSDNWTPHEKVISLQLLDDDGRFAHTPPAWPHDEYALQFPTPYLQRLKNNNSATTSASSTTELNDESNKINDGYRRIPLHSSTNSFIGPGFYDYPASITQAYNNYQFTPQAITTNTATTSVSSGAEGSIPNGVSESVSHGKYFPGGYHPHLGPHVHPNSIGPHFHQNGLGGPHFHQNGLGGPHPHLHPHDYYRRKRLRLKLHPGLIAAPIAGYAAWKAVNALASKPLMVELGWVGNKPNIGIGGGGGGGWGWPPYPYPYPPVAPLPEYPHPPHVAPPVYPINPEYQYPVVPILRPKRKPDEDVQKAAWWNPFTALTPRFLLKKERSCCEEDASQGDDEHPSHRTYPSSSESANAVNNDYYTRD